MRLRLLPAVPWLALLLGAPALAEEALTLDVAEARAMARAHSLALAGRADELEAARARERQAFARFLPRLSLNVRYARLSYVAPGSLTVPVQLPGQAEPPQVTVGEPIEDQFNSSVVLEQPLFTGLSLWRAHDAAQEAVEAARQRARQEAQDLALRVDEAYFGLQKARQLVQVAERSVAVLGAHLEQLERLAREGVSTPLDVARTRTRLAQARVQQLHARAAEGSAQLGLAMLLGVEADRPLGLREEPAPLPEVSAEALAGAVAQRPDLAAARAGAAVKEAGARAAAGALWPQLFLRTQAQYDSPHQRYFPLRNEFNGSWDAAVVLTWSVWDWGATWQAQRAAQLEASAARRFAAQLEEVARTEVQRKRLDTQVASERVVAAEQAASAAALALQRAQNLCAAGQASCHAVLDAEADASRLAAELVQARIDVRLAGVALQRAAGTLSLTPEAP